MAFSGVLERAASLGLAAMVALSCLSVLVDFRSRAQVVHQPVPLLPVEEVETLIAISSKLHAEDWQVSKSSCGSPAWNRSIQPKPLEIRRLITCNCSFGSGTICHVTNIWVKGYNLTGILPPELGNLTQLTELDLTRNYISGPIPPSLAQLTNLAKLSLLGNRLSGTIPLEIGHITTLQELVLEDNLLQGPLPPSLGNLKSLEILILSANNFTGSIPDSFANLRNITSFRIDGSTLAGKLPEFIGNWTNLKELYLQGTSMQGPIPSTVSMLYNLMDLLISDLSGPTSVFPNLKDLTKIRTLVLRNCLLNGSIPDYIGKAARLKTLDLSFNSLTGIIPDMGDLDDLQFMFLNNNSLTGQVPSWILSKNGNFDLSYNNYTGIPPQRDCLQVRVNLISSYSPVSNSAPWCFQKDLPCNENNIHNEVLYINCAGTETSFGNKTYEADQYVDGRSTFYPVTGKWGYSSTGVYMENEGADYVARNTSKHNKTADIYETARGAPQSLKYYGFCMRKGIYNVTLHFAEIKFSNDETFASLGRRIFDISIQGKIVRRDFDIVKKAGGVQIGTTEVFDNVIVNGTTLEIHLYWSGKGTTAIPKKGVYGPLISGISVTLKSRFPDASSGSIGGVTRENSGLSVGLIAGIVVSSFVVLLVICFSIFMIWRRKDDRDPELRGLDLQTGCFTLRQIKLATNNFNSANKIGEGGFGPVYKGILSNVGVVAVKQLSAKSMQGNREFVNEIGMISALQHPNLVKLFGCCMEGNQLLLVYEYLENNSLARAIFGTEEQTLRLDWQTRKNILLGVAKGLTYLHEESRLKIVHRDIKATNVLLDKDLNAKISDFGLAKLHEEEDSHISTRIAGTRGYMAPEYATRGYLTDKADVYSFGIVILETVSGRSNTSYRLKGENVYLVDWAYMLKEKGDLLELVDPTLSSGSYLKEEVEKMLNLSLLCANPSHTLRPLMSSVVDMIEGKAPVQAPIIQQGGSEFASGQQSASFRALQKTTLQDSYNTNVSWESNDQAQQSISTDDVPLDSSSSIISKVDHANDDDDDDDHDDIVPLSSSGRHL